MKRLLRWLPLLALAVSALGADFDSSYWVWQRSAALRDAEKTELKAQNVTTLYWHVGEIDFADGAWHWRDKPVNAPSSSFDGKIVPVIRLVAANALALDRHGAAGLLALIDGYLAGCTPRPTELQIDDDCPDRLLPNYADALRAIHTRGIWLSATALAGWSSAPGWEVLQGSVDELAPMFYDLAPDPSGIGADRPPLPLCDPVAVSAQMAAWHACKIPWRAGLPAFARLTAYTAEGRSRGHIRNFAWDEVAFNSSLATLRGTELGTTLFRVAAPARIVNTPLAAGEMVAARWPDRGALRKAVASAKAAGASGVIYFRLPDEGDSSGWSLRQIGAITAGEDARPALDLRKTADGKLMLINESHADLEPRLSGTNGDRDRGYALEIDAESPIWREAVEGDFWRVTAHIHPDSKPTPAPVLLATRLTFWFSRLRAGESITTGLLQLAPGASFEALRWRVLGSEEQPGWKSIH